VRQKSIAAHRKALELDPGLIMAAQSIVTRRAETGDLEGAFYDARKLLEQFGPSIETHFTLAYVYKYGGMLDASQHHCELALKFDPQDPRLRSCGYSYLYAGKLSRVMDFLRLDEGSYFVHWGTVLYHLRLDEREAALRVVRQAASEPTRGLMEPCLEGVRGPALDLPVAQFISHWERSEDPETAYALAPMLAFCGRQDEALRFMERAVDNNFCTFPVMDQDSIWSNLRANADFQRIRAKGVVCHERFRRMVDAYDEASNQ
jgi:tetratricopeptide (TPR) repeat protein